MTVSKFKANWNRQSTYECRICAHRTRETGLGEQNVELCAACFDLCGYENSMSDDGLDGILPMAKDITNLIVEVEKRGNGDAGWRGTFSKLFAV